MELAKIVVILGAVVILGGIAAIIIACVTRKPAEVTGEDSYFDGNTLQLIGYRILSALVCTVTLSIAYPWMFCMMRGWEVKHTVIHGRRLKFTGKGHQLIGKYLLWLFLTVITLGIYGIWFGLGMKKWLVKHTVYADEECPVESYFSGGAGGYLGMRILLVLLSVFTLGIGRAWAKKNVLAWEARHTHIGGSPLVFQGSGGKLFGKYLLLVLLTPLTLGIYTLCFPVIFLKWQMKHTEALYQTPEIQTRARIHEATAAQDFARYRIAANDQEIAALRSGYTGKESQDALEKMVGEGNCYAAYDLAKRIKGESPVYEGRALELLKQAARGRYHGALLDLAKQSAPEDAMSILTAAAQQGNPEASWLLAEAYERAGDLQHAAYWFKIALEWGNTEATAHAGEYESLITRIALSLAEGQNAPKGGGALGVVLGVIGGVVLLGGVAAAVMLLLRLRPMEATKVPARAPAAVTWVDLDEIQGSTYTAEDVWGQQVQYIIDEEAFFDRDSGTLYISFGCVEYDHYVYLRHSNGWFTERIAWGEGITQVHYPFVIAPDVIEVWAKYDETEGEYLRSHSLQIETGSSLEAEQWLEEKYQEAEPPTEEPQLPETEPPTEEPTEPSIIGRWENWDTLTHLDTGDTFLEIATWVFEEDGTYWCSFSECIPSTDGTGEYFGGTYWTIIDGSGEEGTYTIDGETLILSYYMQGEDPILFTTEYTAIFEGECLTIQRKGGVPGRPMTRVE